MIAITKLALIIRFLLLLILFLLLFIVLSLPLISVPSSVSIPITPSSSVASSWVSVSFSLFFLLSHGVKEVIFIVLFWISKYSITENDFIDILGFKDNFSNFFILWKLFFIDSVSQILKILKSDDIVLIIDFREEPIVLVSIFQANKDFVVEKVNNFFLWHLIIKIIMTANSQELLQKIFLLSLENTRLSIKYDCNTEAKQSQILQRINQIESSMGYDLRVKQQKIIQLNSKISQLVEQNQELQNKLSKTNRHLSIFQKEESAEINGYKATIKMLNQKLRNREQEQYFRQSRKKLTLELEKQLENEREAGLALKKKIYGLEEQKLILSKENSGYTHSISEYRQEVSKLNESNKILMQQIKNLNQQKIQVMSKHEDQIKRITESQKQLKKQFEINKKESMESIREMEIVLKKEKQEFEQLKKSSENTINTVNIRFNEHLRQFKARQSKLKSELDAKAAKLKEYDEYYNKYLKKMNELQFELQKSKSDQKLIQEQCQKLQTKHQEKDKKIEYLQKENRGRQQNIKELKEQLEKNLKQYKEYQKEYEVKHEKMMKEYAELQKKQKKFDEKINEIIKQKKQAVRQWQQIIVEMEKQKDIISSLEKEVENYRKHSNEENSFIKTKRDKKIEIQIPCESNITLDYYPMNEQMIDKQSEFPSQRYSEFTQQNTQRPSINAYTETSDYPQNPYQSQKQIDKPNQMSRNNQSTKMCCQDCLSQGNQNNSPRYRQSERMYEYEQSSQLLPRGQSCFKYIPEFRSQQKKLGQQTSYRDQFSKRSGSVKHASEARNQRNRSTNYQQQKMIPKCNSVRGLSAQYQNVYQQSERKSLKSYNSFHARERDTKIDEIQKYLSFNLEQSSKNHMIKCQSDKRFEGNYSQISSERTQIFNKNDYLNEQQSSNALLSKINKINSWRQDPKQKNGTFYKKIQHNNSSRLNLRQGLKNHQKENLNDIIQKKCMYVLNNR